MTRTEIIETLEQYIQEIQGDLAKSTEALKLLKNGIYLPAAASAVKHKLHGGPIVYGNGHGGHRGKGNSGASPIPQVREALYSILKGRSQGASRKELEEALSARGLILSEHTVHNALRGLGAVPNKAGTGTPKIYSLAENKPKAKRGAYRAEAKRENAGAKITDILRDNPQGITLEGIRAQLANQGIQRTCSGIYHAFRLNPGLKRSADPTNPQAKLYAL